jgi:hypothetical protein
MDECGGDFDNDLDVDGFDLATSTGDIETYDLAVFCN